MHKKNIIRNEKGYSLVELLIVMSMIGILTIIGIPQYSNFIAKSNVKKATNDLLQNARLASTLAIKENRAYLITFNEGNTNTYRIGFDGSNPLNNSLLDPQDGYDTGAVRVVNLQTAYGGNIAFGTFTSSGPGQPDSCPACLAIGGSTVAFGTTAAPVYEQFNPDGSVQFTGSVFVTHTDRGFTYMLRVSYLSGKFDLWKWDGETDNPSPTIINNCINPPVQYCGWTELR